MVDDPRLAGEFLIFGRAQKCTCRKKEKNGICGEPGAMKAKSDSRVQGCAGTPLNSRCANISYMEKSEKVVASNRTPKIKKTPFSLYDASARAGARTEEVCGKWSAARRAGTHSAARDEAIAELAALEEECD